MKSKLRTILFVFGIIAIILTFMPFIAMDYWWVRIFDFPHLQLTGLTLIALLTYFIKFDFKFYGDYVFAGVLLFCLIFQASKIYPYSGISKYQIKNSTSKNNVSLKLLNINVYQENDQYKKVLDEIKTKDPDIALLMETNTIWKNRISASISPDYKHKIEYPLDNTYGILMYSKKQLLNPEIKFLVSDSIPSIDTKVVLDNGSVVQLYCIHPTPPMPQENKRSTDRDAEMMMIAKNVMTSSRPTIVMGDFNDVAWSQTTTLFQNVSQLGDIRIGRGIYSSFNAKNFLMRWPLDHIFVSTEFRVTKLSRGRNIGSDHFPIYAELSFEPELAETQKINKPSNKELEQVEKQIEKFRKRE